MNPQRPPFFDVRLRGFRDRAEVADAWALLDARTSALPPETVATQEAAGRVLSRDVIAEVAVPGYDRAAMDGYALRGEETFGAVPYQPVELSIIGESLPARPFLGRVGSGQAVRIMTGAPIPEGADAVIQAEAAEEHNAVLRIREPIPPQRHVGRRGEDIVPGRTVLCTGRRLRPQDLGLLASIGVCCVDVICRPRVDVLITGDELLPIGSKPDGFRIVDSNSIMLAALIARDGGIVNSTQLLPDNRDRIRDAIQASNAEVLLISGGSSVGKDDHAPSLIAELGELPIHGMALRPASPTGIGFVDNRSVFLLPGNPVSCLCAYDLFAGRAIRRMGGRSIELPYRKVRLPLEAKIVSAIGRVDYVRVKTTNGHTQPFAVSGASILSTTTIADGFVLVDRDLEGCAPGEEVDVYLYDQ